MAIAIVSMGLRMPGARTPQEFWKNIVQVKDGVAPVAEGRWPLPAAYFQQHAADRITHDRLYALENPEESAVGLEIESAVLKQLDPLFHIALGAGRDAFFSSRHQTVDRQRCGVILGNIALPTEASARMAASWLLERLGKTADEKALHADNLAPAALPARVLAGALGLGGGAFTLDAACASSLYAIKLACDALLAGDLDCVLAGGLSRPASLYTQVGFTALQALSKTGRCHAFDHRADGLLVGEGAGIFVLKRLDDAIDQGDQIWAVVRGAGLANDREGRLMAPSSEGQLRAMHKAYRQAGWKPQDVQMIECHATGTPLGDKTEWDTLQQLWAGVPLEAQCVVGSVKPNVGHMLTAAGAAGLAKILLAMREGQLPPTANFERLPAHWNREKPHFRVLQRAEAWEAPVKRAAISGFGFGGINAHLLLEQVSSHAGVDSRPTPRKVALIAAAQLGIEDQAWLQRTAVPAAADAAQAEAYTQAAVPYGLLRIPPTELNEMLPQQLYPLLALHKLALPAFDEATLKTIGCLVGLELDPSTNLYACRWALQAEGQEEAAASLIQPLNADRVIGALGSIVASRIAREARLGGPSFTVSAMEHSGLQALELARAGIAAGDMPAALVFAVDMLGSARARAQVQTHADAGTVLGASVADTTVGLLLADLEWAAERGLPILAVIESAKLQAEPAQDYKAADIYQGSATVLAAVMQGLDDDTWTSGSARTWTTIGSDRQSSRLTLTRGPAPLVAKTLPAHAGVVVDRRDLFAFEPEAPIEMPEIPQVTGIWQQLIDFQKQVIDSHEVFLRYRWEGDALLQQLMSSAVVAEPSIPEPMPTPTPTRMDADQLARSPAAFHEPLNPEPALFDYAACKEFAAGRIEPVFGPDFALIDTYPTRVRLPDDRLLLCQRVMQIEGQPRSMQSGFMITEHDVFAEAWYLDDGRMPTSIAVESGQADLMLSAWLGADFHTRGEAVYRLLDAKVCFHRRLPEVGETIRYAIRIRRFFEQGGTLFFQFGFEATINGEPLMTMTDGCAGFFTEAALAEGRGVKRSQLQLQPEPGQWTGGYQPLVPVQDESYTDAQVDALRRGDYVSAFGPAFADLALTDPKAIPDQDLRLVHRIPSLEVHGGRYGKGRIIGEADIHPDDWFLTCHFVDDQVMPGTLMYECCLHTLRVYLMRMGWVGARADFSFEPIPGITSQLKCRGQVLASTKKVTYEIEIREMGYGPEPYVIGDALMYADDKPIVDITNICLRLPGQSRETLEALWKKPAPAFTYEQILAFSSGRPSDCFGPAYAVFDEQRRIARLPRPPFQFLDRVEWVRGPFMQQNVGTELLAAYDPPENAWYWQAEGTDTMPFAVLLEAALQPCGFMAAYMGSALLSETDLCFRNLSGEARLHQTIRPGSGTLYTQVKSTRISRSGNMIIQDYAFSVSNAQGLVYEGTTSFGYFTTEALAQQVGLRHVPPLQDRNPAQQLYPEGEHWPRSPMLMVDRIAVDGSQLWGLTELQTDAWYFDAHFYQDPVMPGSLGLEALLQTLKAAAHQRWPDVPAWGIKVGAQHSWTYRGQVPPRPSKLHFVLKSEASGPQELTAEGLLYRDQLPIYEIKGLTVEPLW